MSKFELLNFDYLADFLLLPPASPYSAKDVPYVSPRVVQSFIDELPSTVFIPLVVRPSSSPLAPL